MGEETDVPTAAKQPRADGDEAVSVRRRRRPKAYEGRVDTLVSTETRAQLEDVVRQMREAGRTRAKLADATRAAIERGLGHDPVVVVQEDPSMVDAYRALTSELSAARVEAQRAGALASYLRAMLSGQPPKFSDGPVPPATLENLERVLVELEQASAAVRESARQVDFALAPKHLGRGRPAWRQVSAMRVEG